MRKCQLKKSLIALGSIGAAAVFGSTSCQAPSSPAPQGQGTGVNVLFVTDMILFEPGFPDWDTASENGYFILDQNGNIQKLSRNDANQNHDLYNAISCKNGNAILEDAGDYFFFDAQAKAIIFRGNAGGGYAQMFNSNGEPVGVASVDGVSQFLVAFCNGDYVASNECVGCSYGNVTPTSVTFYGNMPAEVFSVPFPSSLASMAVFEQPQGSLKRLQASDPLNNMFVAPIISGNYTIYPEMNGNTLVGFAIVDNATGDISWHDVDPDYDLTAVPNMRFAVDTSNGTFFYFGATTGDIYYGKYDGSQLTELNRVNPGSTVLEADLDGNGRFYWVESLSPTQLNYVDTSGSAGSVGLAAALNAVYDTTNQRILALTDGVVVHDGAHKTYSAGAGSADPVPAGDATNAITNCQAEVLGERTSNLTCYDPTAGSNEVSYIPSTDTNNWELANPDSLTVASALRPVGSGFYGLVGQQFFVGSWTGEWYMCQVGQTTCSALQNVTTFDTMFSPVPVVNGVSGYFAWIDLVNDTFRTFVWSHGLTAFNWDMTKIADLGRLPNSVCGDAGLDDTIIVEELGSGQYHEIKVSSVPDDTSVTPTDSAYQCADRIINVW